MVANRGQRLGITQEVGMKLYDDPQSGDVGRESNHRNGNNEGINNSEGINWWAVGWISIAIFVLGAFIGFGATYLIMRVKFEEEKRIAVVEAVADIGQEFVKPLREDEPVFIISGTPPYGALVSVILPDYQDGGRRSVAVFTAMDSEGNVHLMAVRVPLDDNGEANFTDPRLIEFHEIRMGNPVVARPLYYVGEIHGEIYYFDVDGQQCWLAIRYRNQLTIDEETCLGQ